jgi:YVTN family beta-propeller protein
MDLLLLGPIEARVDGRAIELGARKQRAVLAMLALEAGHTVSADRLAAGLWAEDRPPSERKLVQLYVSHLRRALAGNGAEIVTRGGGYELRLAEGEIDTERFERLLGEGTAREALALWRGAALADVADEPFAGAEIRRLDELRLRASELAIDADLAAGRHREVIGELDALVAEHPLREELHGRRMLALYRSGRQSEALSAYRTARSVLIEQIGVEPGSELRRLHEAILAQDPALDLAPAPPPPATDAPPAVRPPPRRRRSWPLVVAGVLLAFAGLIAFGVSRVLAPDSLPRIPENAVGVIEAEDGRISAQYPVGRMPSAVVAGGGSIWVASAGDGTVTRIDPAREPVITTITVGGRPAGLAFGAGSLWIADGDSRHVVQVDPGANREVGRHEVGNAPRSVAVGGGALWVASGVDGLVRRIDLQGSRAPRSIPLGANPTAIAAGAGAIWVASEEAGTVTRLNPRTGTVFPAINVGNGPSAIAAGAGGVWVLNRLDGTLTRIDPQTNRVAWAFGVGSDPTAVAASDDAVWVAGGEERAVIRVDPGAPRALERTPVGGSPAAIATSGQQVWAAAVAPQSAHRGGTLRAEVPRLTVVPLDWLTQSGYSWQTGAIDSLVYDGLVGYRRTSGIAGATLVGALATGVPVPIDGGRTYTFTLRPGLRYADGRPVQPEDFRASMERFVEVTRRSFKGGVYQSIRGVPRCVERPGRCDLSAGIQTDRDARTITIRLTRPDGDLLHKLTMHWAFVVPADTPRRRIGVRAPPGTGPYRFATWDERSGGALVRNPHFKSWSPQARPAGFADRIEITLRDTAAIESQVAAAQSGRRDLAVLADPFGSLVSRARLRALTTQSPGRVHSVPAAQLESFFLNVSRRPFDSLRMRQALNLAIDRTEVLRLVGGRELATPTCQVLPTGFPGHVPYCPYTAGAAAGGGWTAPDLAQARRLAAASGRTEHVTITVPAFRRALGRLVVATLEDLGLRASLRMLGDNDSLATRAQMGYIGFSSDYLSPSTFIATLFGCGGTPSDLNASRFCDPRLDRQIELALAARGAEAAARWAAADRVVVDRAPAVALANHRGALLTSERVGNVQSHLQWFLLLDQLWVR